MTADNRTNEPTPEQILWELYPDDVMDHNRRANCHLFLERLRAHGLLSEGAPSEEQVERAAETFYEDPAGLTSWARLNAAEPDIAERYRVAMGRALAAAGRHPHPQPSLSNSEILQRIASQEVIDDAADEQDDLRLHMLASQEPLALDPEKVLRLLGEHAPSLDISTRRYRGECLCGVRVSDHELHQSDALCEAYTEGRLT